MKTNELSLREQKSLKALKHALATFRLNKIGGTFTEEQIRSAIREYGPEHLAEVEGSVLGQNILGTGVSPWSEIERLATPVEKI